MSMIEKDDGGAAFPVVHPEGMGVQYFGLSMRDYFAAKAMQGMLAYPGCDQRGSHHNNNTYDGVAEMAYKYADAMLEARKQ